jgi:hypothetical protein
MKVIVALTTQIAGHAILKVGSDGFPHDENDPDAEVYKKKQCGCPEHNL